LREYYLIDGSNTVGGIQMSRKSARESTMKLIYQMDINHMEVEELLENFYDSSEETFSAQEKSYIKDCLAGIIENKENIDKAIESHLNSSWKLSRVAKVELAILRLAVYEMLYREDVPNKVAVNEAIELAKQYSGEDSGTFVNGVLGSLIKEL
jgi:N utilization substance protein B